MRHRPVALLAPPEYPRPVIPAGLNEDQQDALLDRLMNRLLTGRPQRSLRTPAGGAVQVVSDGRWGRDEVTER